MGRPVNSMGPGERKEKLMVEMKLQEEGKFVKGRGIKVTQTEREKAVDV